MKSIHKGTAMLVAGLAVLWVNSALWLPIAFKSRGYWAIGGEWIIIIGVSAVAVWTCGSAIDLWEHWRGERSEVGDGEKK
jgi:hypothetical protein